MKHRMVNKLYPSVFSLFTALFFLALCSPCSAKENRAGEDASDCRIHVDIAPEGYFGEAIGGGTAESYCADKLQSQYKVYILTSTHYSERRSVTFFSGDIFDPEETLVTSKSSFLLTVSLTPDKQALQLLNPVARGELKILGFNLSHPIDLKSDFLKFFDGTNWFFLPI